MSSILAGVGSIIGGLGGMFGGRSGSDSGRELKRTARAARQYGEEYGFNPLTLLGVGATGATGGAGGTAPLASIQMITEGLKDINDVTSGDAARRRAADQLELDLAKVRLDQARSGVVVYRDNAADTVGNGLSPLGRNNSTFSPRAGAKPRTPFSMGENPIAPGREDEIMPITNTSGVFEIENTITRGPITVPGDSEPWGIDELATAVIVGGPQAVYNNMKTLPEQISIREGSMADRIRDWWNNDNDDEKDEK